MLMDPDTSRTVGLDAKSIRQRHDSGYEKMNRFAALAASSQELEQAGIALADVPPGDSSVDFLRGAQVDLNWVGQKFATKFSPPVLNSLKKSVYAVGQGGDRWFSGGGELSPRQASMVLDYLVLIELLIQCRGDLEDYRDDLFDCRDQLVMQISRSTEGQPERALALVEGIVARLGPQLSGD
jgi:hypothetical protein